MQILVDDQSNCEAFNVLKKTHVQNLQELDVFVYEE